MYVFTPAPHATGPPRNCFPLVAARSSAGFTTPGSGKFALGLMIIIA